VSPITKQVEGYPFEVAVRAGKELSGMILADHVKNADWRARQAEKIGAAPEVLEEVLGRLGPLLGMG
jgi:mRNA interferase MazF